MGLTMHELKTRVSPNAGNEIQSCVWMLNFYQLGSKFIKKILKTYRLSDLRS